MGRTPAFLTPLGAAAPPAAAQQLAFPGAEGAGRFSEGARGARVIAVTNLDAGPGSLRAALDADRPGAASGTQQDAPTVTGGRRIIIDNEKDDGGWPELRAGPVPVDGDDDGMPDASARRHRLDPARSDGAADRDRDGWSNLEEYLNGLVAAAKDRS